MKKAECQRIDPFELCCWRKLLGVPWTARRSNQSILKEINTEYSLEGLKPKIQYLGHLTQRKDPDADEKTLMLGKHSNEGREESRARIRAQNSKQTSDRGAGTEGWDEMAISREATALLLMTRVAPIF